MTDLYYFIVYLVLLHTRRVRSAQDFFRIITSKKAAVDLLVAYCKQRDLDLLKVSCTYCVSSSYTTLF